MPDVSFRSLLKVLAVVAGVWLLWQLWFVVVLVAIALVIAGTLNPMVTWLEEHGVPRSPALVLIFVGMLGILFVVGLLTIPPLVSQLVGIMEKAPALQGRLADDLSHSRLLRPLAASVRSFRAAEYMGMAGQQVLEWSSQILVFVGEAITTIFLSLYLISSREREQAALFAIVPRGYHLRLARILGNLEEIVGGYVRGQVITSLLIMIFTFGLLTVFDVPNALAIAVFAGMADVLPFIGGLLATTPAVLATLTVGVPAAIAVLAIMILYQEFESRILVPRVYGRVLRLSPATVIVALLAGGTLLGIVGALLALPAAAALRMIVKELRVELPGEQGPSTTLRMREAAAEREYEQRAAGAPMVEAAKIAKEMAEERRDAPAKSSPKPSE
jgi:predicted PurR-regulated permease PerM